MSLKFDISWGKFKWSLSVINGLRHQQETHKLQYIILVLIRCAYIPCHCAPARSHRVCTRANAPGTPICIFAKTYLSHPARSTFRRRAIHSAGIPRCAADRSKGCQTPARTRVERKTDEKLNKREDAVLKFCAKETAKWVWWVEVVGQNMADWIYLFPLDFIDYIRSGSAAFGDWWPEQRDVLRDNIYLVSI